jgi:hypothetical protein
MTSMWDLAWEAVNRHHGMQDVAELAAVLAVVGALDPHSRIAEIGAGGGGTLWAWRQLGADVWAVTEPVPNPAACGTHGARVLWADSHSGLARRWLAGCAGAAGFDVLHIDGDHSYAGARADFADYAPLVRPGGLVLLHDVANAGDAPGVMLAWQEISEQYGDAAELISTGPLGTGAVTMQGVNQ